MVDNDFIGLKVMITPLHVKFLMERMRRKVSETDKSTLFQLPRRTRIGIISWRQENMFENMSYSLILPCLQNDKAMTASPMTQVMTLVRVMGMKKCPRK